MTFLPSIKSLFLSFIKLPSVHSFEPSHSNPPAFLQINDSSIQKNGLTSVIHTVLEKVLGPKFILKINQARVSNIITV